MYNVNKSAVEPVDFLFYHSPSIPYDFPKERIPKNLCEEQLLSVYKCYLDFKDQSEEILRAKYCHKYANEFNQCKKRRDMNIFHEIKTWEEEKVQHLSQELKNIYVKSLQEELQQLRENFEKTPASENNAEKRWRINADIMQTRWRIDYVKKIINPS